MDGCVAVAVAEVVAEAVAEAVAVPVAVAVACGRGCAGCKLLSDTCTEPLGPYFPSSLRLPHRDTQLCVCHTETLCGFHTADI